MTFDTYKTVVRENSGFREVVEALAGHFALEVPGGFPTLTNWFSRHYVAWSTTFIHQSYDDVPASENWTDSLCFLSLIDLMKSIGTVAHRITEEENDPVSLFKGVIRRSEKGCFLYFQNIFTVKRTETNSYHITIHKYPSEFFHFIVMDDSELLSFVVRNQIMINGVQLELPPEAHLSDFTD